MTRNGRPAAVLMSAEEFESWKETQAIRHNPALMAEITEGLRQLERGAKVSFADVFGEPLYPKKKKR